MDNRNLTVLSVEEQEGINGGLNLSCAAAGFLIVGGILTVQPEYVAYGIFGAVTQC